MNSIMKNAVATIAGNTVTQSPSREGPVVIVDDDTNDALLAEETIDELHPRFPVQILASGQDLVAYLQERAFTKTEADINIRAWFCWI